MNAKNLSKVLALIVVLVCAQNAAINVKARTAGGSIQGTITDPGGAIVPGATVVATNVATKAEADAASIPISWIRASVQGPSHP